MANSTPDTPDVSETKLAALKMASCGPTPASSASTGPTSCNKPELLAKVKDYHYAQAHGGKHRNGFGPSSSTAGHPSASEAAPVPHAARRHPLRVLVRLRAAPRHVFRRGSAASSTNTCRSHEVTGLSAPTGSVSLSQ